MATGVRQLFGMAITAAFLRAKALSLDGSLKTICEGVALGFGLGQDDGDTLYYFFSSSQNLGQTKGFDSNSAYATLELDISNILTSFLPLESPRNLTVLTTVTQALIWSYSVNSSVDVDEMVTLIGQTLVNVATKTNGNQPFKVITSNVSTIPSVIIQPFDANTINRLLLNDYSLVVLDIGSSPKTEQAPLVNYNWYDVSSIMSGPNLQTMKDIENQYYFITGKLIYDQNLGQLPTCIEDTINITTSTGTITSTYIRNTPCVTPDTYIGPPSYLNFGRVFNDGPSSSGDFTTDVKNTYINFDKHILPPKDYQSNSVEIFSFKTGSTGQFLPLINGGGSTFLDNNGRYDLNSEYANSPDTMACVIQPQRMHVGDNLPRRKSVFGGIPPHCVGFVVENLTGFKYVSLELDQKLWSQNPLYLRGNPTPSTNGVLQRILNIDANPYLATEQDGVYMPYYFVDPVTYWYVGPPQLNGANSLPTLGFYQFFDSPTFGDKMSIVIYPTISHAFGNQGNDTSRDYEMSPIPLVSGLAGGNFSYRQPNQSQIEFQTSISSNLTGYDDIYKQFFGMGDAFGGEFNIQSYMAENAGFQYTGYFSTGIDGNFEDLISGYQQYLLGSPIKTMRYINGYSTPGGQVVVTKFNGQDSSGNIIPYYYFDNRLLNRLDVSFDDTVQWNWFAPLPNDLDNLYDRVYQDQTVENYMPRYSRGPYAIEEHSFLYPNAQAIDFVYFGKLNGFPTNIEFDLEVREETIRELYCTFHISTDGQITNQKFTRVMRALPDGAGIVNLPIMTNIFVPDNPIFATTYDFHNFQTGSDFEYVANTPGVNNDFAPLDVVTNTAPSGKNSAFYNQQPSLAGGLFIQGVIQTGNGSQGHKIYRGLGMTNSEIIFSELPMTVGLFHGFKTLGKHVTLEYVPPIFNVTDQQIEVSQNLLDAFPVMNTEGIVVKYDNTDTVTMTGQDPLFFELVGGRRGGLNAVEEGGYNSHDFIGDRWNGMAANNYKFQVFPRSDLCPSFTYRYPILDDEVVVFNTTATGSTIWMRGGAYTPFNFGPPYIPLPSNKSFHYQWDKGSGNLNTKYHNGFFTFDIAQLFPMVLGTGWYDPSGLTIGPFDRDVVLGVLGANQLIASTQFYVDGKKLSDEINYDAFACGEDRIRGTVINTGIIPSQLGADPNFAIFAKILSGNTANINVFSEGTGVGIPTGLVSIYTYKPNWQSPYDINIHTGEQGWITPQLYAANGLETPYVITHSRFEDLAGTYDTFFYSESGFIYPTPEDDFINQATRDANGNLIYPNNVTVENYWKKKAQINNHSVLISGWRQGSRKSITIKNIKITYNEMPYQSYKLIIPSGNCLVSGHYGYYAQADNSVFSEGVELENITPNDPIAKVYDPIYISEVLDRLPWLNLPSGSGVSPILKAPSRMMQRRFISGISDGQSYVGVMSEPPFNYNKLLWPALSDLETLNPGETIEEIPPDDGNTFTNSSIMFSASQGQNLPNGTKNPNIIKEYGVINQYQMYDSVATDALINSGIAITARRGRINKLTPNNMSGALVPLGTALVLINKGLT